jgi:hypothetical protein
MQNLTPGGLEVTIHVWANTYGFTGHFELFAVAPDANEFLQNSPNVYWHAGGSGYDFYNNGAFPSLCAHAWKGTSSTGFTDIGTVCVYVAL